MLGFLKRLFGGTTEAPEAPKTATVTLYELEGWLKRAQAPTRTRFVEQLAATKSQIGEKSSIVREKLESLQSAQLMNPDIPDRAKDFMIGNREEYTRRVIKYLDKLNIPDDAESLSSFLSEHQNDAEEFTKGIMRPFQILQEFFALETKEITGILAQMEQDFISLHTLQKESKVTSDESVNDDIRLFMARQQQLKDLETDRAELEKQIKEAVQAIKSMNVEEERLLKDPARVEAIQNVGEAQARVRAHEQKIRDLFSKFEPGLRKFHRMAVRHVKITEQYLRDPVAALIQDLHLEIIEVIEDIKRLVQFQRLPVGDKKAQVLDAIQYMNKEYLGNWMREYGQLAKIEKEAQQMLEQGQAAQTLSKIEKLRTETRRNTQLNEQKYLKAKKDLERINLEELKAKLEQKTSEISGITVTVTY